MEDLLDSSQLKCELGRHIPYTNIQICGSAFTIFATAHKFPRLRLSLGDQEGWQFSCICSRNETNRAVF